ncbi:MAG: zinc ribbon domain-containing protein [Anaerolineales bacterium]|nr:zinc ribbon domain-containing protein [Anaerolineales bacterium]
MEQRIFHGDLTTYDVANALIAHFHRGNLRAQAFGDDRSMKVQIATRQGASSGGQTAVTVQIQRVTDGVMVTVGQQAWMGVAASMGKTLFAALQNPWNLLDRLDDIAQDIENLQISETVWQVIGKLAQSRRASTQISERLQRAVCEYCGTANPVGEGSCIACGAPLGNVQPRTCAACGFVVLRGERSCPSCGKPIPV